MKKILTVVVAVAVGLISAVFGAALATGKLGSLVNAISNSVTKTRTDKQAAAPYGRPLYLPELGTATEIKPGILMYKVQLMARDEQRRLFVYLPKGWRESSKKMLAVFIAPAGTASFFGSALDGGEEEHLPYVNAGCAVIAYELSGPVAEKDKQDDAKLLVAAAAYKRSEAGTLNARDAIDYALAKVPVIDPARIYVAGHSSAGAVALAVAEHDPRVKACIAYAPVTDTLQRLEKRFEVMPELERNFEGYRDYILRTSPIQNVSRLKVPLFLFHADDDSIVTTADLTPFLAAAKKTNPNVVYASVPRGEHYDSMIRQGIPKAITWMKTLP